MNHFALLRLFLNAAIDRRMFLEAALKEMSGKEKELSTDPDCSKIVERMIHSMDDFIKRDFMSRLLDS